MNPVTLLVILGYFSKQELYQLKNLFPEVLIASSQIDKTGNYLLIYTQQQEKEKKWAERGLKVEMIVILIIVLVNMRM